MIEFKQGNILDENAVALVNTVNCVGVMGKSIALQFKRVFPEVFKEYKKACTAQEVQPGKMFIVSTERLFPRYAINFPTKRHWKEKSRIEDIKSGLEALAVDVKRLRIESIAIPPLGCGNGGLAWNDVKPLIIQAFENLPEVKIIIFEPSGAPTADKMKVGTEKSKMTRARALFVRLLDLYGVPGYRLSKLEIQKLAYFLQEAGEPLRLRDQKNQYGLYAENLNHVLQAIDGHFIQGYGDRSQNSQISVLPAGREEAQAFLANCDESHAHLERVSNLIMGFETPYGMEMLATVYWVTKEYPQAVIDCDLAISLVQEWSERKQNIFKVSHSISL